MGTCRQVYETCNETNGSKRDLTDKKNMKQMGLD